MSAELSFLAREVGTPPPPAQPAVRTYHRPASSSDAGLDSLLQTLVNEAERVPQVPPSAPERLEQRSPAPAPARRSRVGQTVAAVASFALLAALALAGARRGAAVRLPSAAPGVAATNLESFLQRSGEDFLL